MKKLILLLLLISNVGFSQIKMGNNPMVLNANALLEMESTNRGLLLPRISLTAKNSASPLSDNVAGMVVYNLATAGVSPNNVTPGYYFNDGTKWNKIVTTDDILTANGQTWNDVATKTAANSNSQNIYQMGKVGVKTVAPVATLDVNGGSYFGVHREPSDALKSFKDSVMNVVSPTNMTSYNSLFEPETAIRLIRAGLSGVKYNSMADIRIGSYVGGNDYMARTSMSFNLLNGMGFEPDNEVMFLRSDGKIGLSTNTPLSKLSISPKQYESKITLYDNGSITNHFGLGVSPGQLNYQAQTYGAHVFFVGGINAETVANETFRVHDSGVKLSKAPVGKSSDDFLVLDPTDKVVKVVSASTLNSISSPTSNGIVKTNGIIQLGGTLDANTTINGNANSLNLANISSLGVNTTAPTATLDIDGNLRVRTLPAGSINDAYVTVDANGVIHKFTPNNIYSGPTINQFEATNNGVGSGNLPNSFGVYSTYDANYAYVIYLPVADMTNINTTKIVRAMGTWSTTLSKTNTNLAADLFLEGSGSKTTAIFMSDGVRWKRIDN